MKIYFWYLKLLSAVTIICIFALPLMASVAIMHLVFLAAGSWAAFAVAVPLSGAVHWLYGKLLNEH